MSQVTIFEVMERYQENLSKFLKSQDLPLKERLKIAIQLVKEVKKVHSGKVLHRDLKPTNVMLNANKELALVDFGIGRGRVILRGSSGTPGFNAPEQFSGENQKYPVDIYSLGKNLILIFFKWKIGWNMMLSSKDWITSQKKAEDKLAPFSDFFDIIRQMLQVSFKGSFEFLKILNFIDF